MNLQRATRATRSRPKSVSEPTNQGKEKYRSKAARSARNPPSARIRTILLVDDGTSTRLLTKWFLSCVGYIVHAFSSAEEALAQFNPRIHDLVVTDNRMKGMTGAEMAHIIKLRSSSTPVLMYTGALPADRSCVDALLQRPTSLPVLKDAVDKLLAARP